MSDLNPCMSCGACCAYFRVSFYWAEADDAGGSVPAQLTEPVTPFLRCMRGTNCRIYEQRPSPCREFMMSGENDEANEACDRARAYYGLPPLYKDMLFHTSTEAATDDAFRVQL